MQANSTKECALDLKITSENKKINALDENHSQKAFGQKIKKQKLS